MNLDRVQQAIACAVELHGDQRRKGSDTPYLFHLLAVASLVAEYGGAEDEIIGAILHDAVEDAGGTETAREIERRFGADVAAIVNGASDSDSPVKPPWKERKEAFVNRLVDASPSVRLVVAADKIHNSTSTVRDLRRQGADVWSLFRGGRDGTLWYYDAVLKALRQGWDHPILGELERRIARLRELADSRP